MSLNRVIGYGGKLPWHLPEDFRWFKKMTLGNVTVMGRKTFETLPTPLPNRQKLILTHHPRKLIRDHPEVFGYYKEWRGGKVPKCQYQFHFTKLNGEKNADIWIFNSLDKIRPEEFSNEIFVCGGAEIYAQLLPRCSDLYLSVVQRECEGDAFFPPFEHLFEFAGVVQSYAQFEVRHYTRL